MSQHLVDEIHVINLQRRPERLQAFREREIAARTNPIWDECLPVIRRFEAHDGWDDLELPELWSSWGAYGCWASHLAVLEGALSRGSTSVMVFEDDAELMPDFAERFHLLNSLVPQWEALSLGGEHLRRPIPIHGALRCRMVARTHAYAVRGAALMALVDVLKRFHGAYPHDWEQAMLLQWYRWYAPVQWFVGQVEGYSDITSKIEPYRRWS